MSKFHCCHTLLCPFHLWSQELVADTQVHDRMSDLETKGLDEVKWMTAVTILVGMGRRFVLPIPNSLTDSKFCVAIRYGCTDMGALLCWKVKPLCILVWYQIVPHKSGCDPKAYGRNLTTTDNRNDNRLLVKTDCVSVLSAERFRIEKGLDFDLVNLITEPQF